MYKEIDAVEFDSLLHTKDDIEIIDVREKSEWDMINIPKSKLIPLSEIAYRVNEIDFSRDVYIFCRS
jgi:rhodanese-related sulfurtransferase